MGEEIIELCLCEPGRMYLKPGGLYRFIVMEDCETAKRLAAIYNHPSTPTS